MLNRDALFVGVIWAVLTAAGEVLVQVWDPFPLAAAEEAVIVDSAFTILTILAVPVFAFVLAVLGYSVLRFRRRGEPAEDGPPVHSHRPVVAAWFAITTALTVLVIVHPGVTGLLDLRERAQQEPDLVIRVEGAQFYWKSTYLNYDVFTFQELVLPVNRRVRFEVYSLDVLHAFWVPAFRMKTDAVPGMRTTISVTPNTLGSFADDPGLRLQCAEMCGIGHANMYVPIRVVEFDEFEAWIQTQAPVY